ncbi:MAG: DUF917 domain-containing protein [bacterium]|nr:DUF917 domain-containing protein [bacterium]
MRYLSEESIENISVGAAFLGSGGGGNPYYGKLLAIDNIKKRGPIKVIDIDELNDDDLIITSSGMGAPCVALEKVDNSFEYISAFQELEKHIGKKAKAVISIEMGGLNSLMPMIVASELNLPLVDGDSMERAFPELQMVSYTIHGIPETPLVLADEKGNTVLLKTIDNFWTEKIARSVTSDMGGIAAVASFPINKKTLKNAFIPNSLSKAEKIGKIIRDSAKQNVNPISKLCEYTGAVELFKGKISDISNRIVKGFSRGNVVVESTHKNKIIDLLSIDFQNEFLIAYKDNTPIGTTPDLIVLLDEETHEPVTTESLKYGIRVIVLGVPCHPCWRTEVGLKLVGPKYFGYDVEFIPVEKRKLSGR